MRSNHCIVKESTRIRKLLDKRFKELNLKSKEIVADAREKGMLITEANFSRYLKNKGLAGGLPQESIIWLTMRYGIPVTLLVGKPLLNGNRLELVLPPYDEKECIKNVKKHYKF